MYGRGYGGGESARRLIYCRPPPRASTRFHGLPPRCRPCFWPRCTGAPTLARAAVAGVDPKAKETGVSPSFNIYSNSDRTTCLNRPISRLAWCVVRGADRVARFARFARFAVFGCLVSGPGTDQVLRPDLLLPLTLHSTKRRTASLGYANFASKPRVAQEGACQLKK